MKWCASVECPLAALCRLGTPNHPKPQRIGVSPIVPTLSYAWYGDGVGNLGMTQVAENWWCDEYESFEERGA